MRLISLATVLLLSAGIANAGMLDGLRELRGTMGEAIQTKREINGASEEMGVSKPQETYQEQQERKANSPVKTGDVLVGKTSSVKVYKEANKKSAKLTQITRSDEAIYMGEEQNGLYKVTVGEDEGWVDKLLVKKQ